MSMGLESMRHAYEETRKDAGDPLAEQVEFLRRVWGTVCTDDQANLYLEHETLASLKVGTVLLYWRDLDLDDPQDELVVLRHLETMVTDGYVPLERYDCLMVYRSGLDGYRAVPHSLSLLRQYRGTTS